MRLLVINVYFLILNYIRFSFNKLPLHLIYRYLHYLHSSRYVLSALTSTVRDVGTISRKLTTFKHIPT